MFDIFKGGSFKLSITLDRPTPVYAPGETISARITFENDRALKTQGGRFIVTGEERYEYVASITEDDEGGTSVNKTWGSRAVEAFRFDFLPESTLEPGTHTWEARFTLDPRALPSCDGQIVQMRWSAKATIARSMAQDINSVARFQVTALIPLVLPLTGRPDLTNEPDEAEMSITLADAWFFADSPATGTLTVTPKQDIHVDAVRLELIHFEYVPDIAEQDQANEIEEHLATVPLAGAARLKAGQPYEFPIRLALPQGAAGAVQLNTGSMGCRLKAVLNRPLRADTFCTKDFGVYNRPEA